MIGWLMIWDCVGTSPDSKVNWYEKHKQITHILKVYQLEFVLRYYDPIYYIMSDLNCIMSDLPANHYAQQVAIPIC